MSSIFKAMRQKKKRAVDPNAPPRPTLLGHEKVIKDARSSITDLQSENQRLERRIGDLEAKIRRQSDYLNTLHQYVHTKLKS
jgi:predicted RNase H-like nuclease (RuvC/YqgF family)